MVGAYYNENDRFAAAWLRALMRENVIAQGDVDERSIEQIRPRDLNGYRQCHFFAGIGVWSWALRQSGWTDDLAAWTGSCPCQPFSLAGKRTGFADERHLWPAWFWLIENAKPRGVPVFGEQIASKDGLTWLDLVQDDMEGIRHTFWPVAIPACGFGSPHIRQRLYFVAHTQMPEILTRFGQVQEGTNAHQAHRLRDCGIDERLAFAGGGRCDSSITRNSSPKATSQSNGYGALGCGSPGKLANSGTRGRGLSRTETGRMPHAQECGIDGVLGYSSRDRWNRRRTGETRFEEGPTRPPQQGHSDARDLGDAASHGRPEHQRLQRKGAESNSPSPSFSGFTNGFWQRVEWLYCRDGRFRPVEPGTFPLATGATNRVGRLRGYGNALCAPQAQAFIEAYIETMRRTR